LWGEKQRLNRLKNSVSRYSQKRLGSISEESCFRQFASLPVCQFAKLRKLAVCENSYGLIQSIALG
jgi:hypothetical protein